MLVALAAACSAAAAKPSLQVVASRLDNPRKLFVGADGAVYVAEAGTGGRDRCVTTRPKPNCVGLSGAITRIGGGAQRRVVTRLVSVATPDKHRAAGPADVLVRGGTYYVLLQDAFLRPNGGNVLGPDGATAGDLISTRPGRASPTVIADFAAFEAAHDPDHGAGPGTRLGNPRVDSDPYAFTAYRGGFAVVDAAANDLLWAAAGRKVRLLAVFPTQTVTPTAAERKLFRIPATMKALRVQSVPTSVAIGPDGALYVGELTGLPFRRGLARVWRVVPGRKPSVYASGFTNVADIAFDGRDLLVLEIAARGLTDAHSPGALIRVAPGGTRTVLASTGLVSPAGVAVGEDGIYVSNYGTSPGSGPGHHGEVVRLSVS